MRLADPIFISFSIHFMVIGFWSADSDSIEYFRFYNLFKKRSFESYKLYNKLKQNSNKLYYFQIKKLTSFRENGRYENWNGLLFLSFAPYFNSTGKTSFGWGNENWPSFYFWRGRLKYQPLVCIRIRKSK